MKILPIIAIAFILLSLGTIEAKQFIWTEYSDSTYVEFEIIEITPEPPKPPIEPSDDTPSVPIFEDVKIPEIFYGEWICVNNRLQRQVWTDGIVSIEYGRACGFEITPEVEEKAFNFFILVPLALFLMILATIALIVGVIARH